MRILATASPNKSYENIQCISDLILEARLENNKIKYFETHTKDKTWVIELKENRVFSLFSDEVPVYERPFLFKENRNFYFILHRERPRFHQFYLNIKNKKN